MSKSDNKSLVERADVVLNKHSLPHDVYTLIQDMSEALGGPHIETAEETAERTEKETEKAEAKAEKDAAKEEKQHHHKR